MLETWIGIGKKRSLYAAAADEGSPFLVPCG